MQTTIEKKILPEIRHIKLRNFTTNRITMFLNDVVIIKDKKIGRPVRPIRYYKDFYIQLIYSKLHSLFDIAIKQEWIKENPCENAIKPRRNKSKKLPPP